MMKQRILCKHWSIFFFFIVEENDLFISRKSFEGTLMRELKTEKYHTVNLINKNGVKDEYDKNLKIKAIIKITRCFVFVV